MKYFLLVFNIVAIAALANAQNFTDPVDYNDFIVDQQNKIGEKILLFSEKLGEEDMTKEEINPTLEDMLKTAKESVDAVRKLGPFEGDNQLKEASLALFQFYTRIIDNDYRELVALLFGSDLNDAAMTRVNEIIQKIQNEEATYDTNFLSAQQAFAQKNNITLEENELQEQIDKD